MNCRDRSRKCQVCGHPSYDYQQDIIYGMKSPLLQIYLIWKCGSGASSHNTSYTVAHIPVYARIVGGKTELGGCPKPLDVIYKWIPQVLPGVTNTQSDMQCHMYYVYTIHKHFVSLAYFPLIVFTDVNSLCNLITYRIPHVEFLVWFTN